MRKVLATVTLVSTVALTGGCFAQGGVVTGYEYKETGISNLHVPASAKRGFPVDVALRLIFPDSSWSLDRVDFAVDNLNREVTIRPFRKRELVWVPLPYPAVGYAQATEAVWTGFSFVPGSAGDYTFQYSNGGKIGAVAVAEQ